MKPARRKASNDEKGMCVIKWFGNADYLYRDTLDGFQIPTIIVLVTWVWLLVGGIMHHPDLNHENCISNNSHERNAFISHSIGVAATLILVPFLHGSQWGNLQAKIAAEGKATAKALAAQNVAGAQSSFRPTNRFTTKAQVAVDVNTPLNFA